MRTNIEPRIIEALESNSGIRLASRMKVYDTRLFVEADDIEDNSPDGYVKSDIVEMRTMNEDFDVIDGEGLGLTACVVGTHYEILLSSSNIPIVLDIVADNTRRPGLQLPYLWIQRAGRIYRYTLDVDKLMLEDPDCILQIEDLCAYTKPCVIRPFSGNLPFPDFAGIFAMDEGGIRPALMFYNATQWEITESDSRFMAVDNVITAEDPAYINYTDCVYFQSQMRMFFYFSHPDGSLQVTSWNLGGEWEDIFIAIPKDLSVVALNNLVFLYDRVYLSLQFERTKEYSGNRFNLICWSVDGRTFSLDRWTGISDLGHPFQIGYDSDDILYLSATNRIMSAGSPFSFSRDENTQYTEILTDDILTIDYDVTNQIKVVVANGDEKYFDSKKPTPLGAICDIEMGVETDYPTAGDFEWFLFERCVITNRNTAYPTRNLELQLMQEGLWRSQNMTYPFYLELVSRSSVRDIITDLDTGNLSTLITTQGSPEPLSADFWVQSNGYFSGGLGNGSHPANSFKDYTTGDLVTRGISSTYPTIDSFPIHPKIYGWSRIGLPSTNPNTADDTPADNLNDEFTIVFNVKAAATDSPIRVITIGATYAVDDQARPPQTWKEKTPPWDARPFPVAYEIPSTAGLKLGDRVISIIVKASSVSPTVMNLERIEIPEVTCYIRPSTQSVEIVKVPVG